MTIKKHHRTCLKVPHTGTGYMHAEDDPYDVDGVAYCGRCHELIAGHTVAELAMYISSYELTQEDYDYLCQFIRSRVRR